MSEEANVPAVINSLNSLEALSEALPEATDTDVMKELGGQSAFLPFLTLVQSGSPLCGPPHEMPQGIFALRRGREEVENQGKEIHVYVCDWRNKAMFADKMAGTFEVSYDHTSEKYLRFQAEANVKNGEPGYFWGFEFLLFNLETGEFFTFFCNNPTLRNCATNEMHKFVHKAVTLEVVPVSDRQKRYSWWAFKTRQCSIEPACEISVDAIKAQVDAFKNEKDTPDSNSDDSEESEEGRDR